MQSNIHTLPASIYSTLLGYQVEQVKQVFLKIIQEPKNIIDATCHIGGDTLHFAEIFPQAKILALDIDEKAITCLHKNIEATEKKSLKERITGICVDCISYIKFLKPGADLFYFDPPWGGPNYITKKNIHLYLNGNNVVEIINFILENDLGKNIVLKIPRNFDLADFRNKVKGNTRLYIIKKRDDATKGSATKVDANSNRGSTSADINKAERSVAYGLLHIFTCYDHHQDEFFPEDD